MESYEQRQTNSLSLLKYLLILWFFGYISTTSHIYLAFLIRIISAHTGYNSYGPWRFAQWMLFVFLGDRLFVSDGYNIFIFKKFSNGKTDGDVGYVLDSKGCSPKGPFPRGLPEAPKFQNRRDFEVQIQLIQFWDCYASKQKLRSAVLPVSSRKYRHRS